MPTPNAARLTSQHDPLGDVRDSSAYDPFRGVKPLVGCLVPLKTKQELCAVDETASAYVVELPLTSANEAVNILKTFLPTHDPDQPLHHLRRFAKTDLLPPHLRPSSNPAIAPTIHLLIPALVPFITSESLISLLQPISTLPLNLRHTLIPLTLPKSVEQAQEFTIKYWPCVYNPASHSASYAPPPFQLSQTLSQIGGRAGWYLALADALGAEAARSSRGRIVGAVIVDTDAAEKSAENSIVAVAGDARWWPCPTNSTSHGVRASLDGRPEQHAVMRAISQVSQLRIMHTHSRLQSLSASPTPSFTPLETEIFSSSSNPVADGTSTSSYLCTNLSIYVSHEPCTCCSMAILHSRFRNVVFRRRMPGTGALIAETGAEAGSSSVDQLEKGCSVEESGEGKSGRVPEQVEATEENRAERAERRGLGYGLFWRKELNWRVLGWEFLPGSTDAGEDDGKGQDIFNA